MGGHVGRYADRYFDGDGVRLHAAVWEQGAGPGTPAPAPLLILHGIWESCRTFADAASRLSASRTVYCLDLRGHGRSDRPPAGYRFADYAADVAAVLPQLGGGAVDVLGHSLGANVALYLAADRPALLRRVVAVDPPILTDQDWPPVRADMRRWRELRARPLPEIVEAVGSSPTRTEQWRRMIAAALADTADGVFAAMVDGEQGPVDWDALLAPVANPVLALAADPQQPGGLLVGHRLAAFRSALPAATVRPVAGAGHHIEVDRPEEFLEAVTTFLE
jgi:pimeloyl-ACP methyl ester carboxylesterase